MCGRDFAADRRPPQLGVMRDPTILDDILTSKRQEVARLQLFRSAIRQRAEAAGPPRGFEAALRRPGEVAVVAEFKRRSPSAGDISPYAQPAGVASVYASAGAAAVSILTDEHYFGGSLQDLRAAKRAVGVPILRKDFTLDSVQLYEALAAGADAVLLIVRLLADAPLRELLALAGELGLAALVEAHDEEETDRALEAGARIVGVNARDLATLTVDLERSLRLIEQLPADVIVVAESGIQSGEDVAAAGSAGADAVLVGGWLMSGDPAEGVEALVGHPKRPRIEGGPGRAP